MKQSLLQTALKPYTLVVVDMQPGFEASRGGMVIEGVRDEVRNAIRQNMPVVIVESAGKYGRTDKRILDELSDYDTLRWIVQYKSYRHNVAYSAHSGAEQVAEAATYFRYPLERFRVCGVNTHICVFFTAMQLGHIFPDCAVEVPLSACEDQYASRREAAKLFDFYAREHRFSNYLIEGRS